MSLTRTVTVQAKEESRLAYLARTAAALIRAVAGDTPLVFDEARCCGNALAEALLNEVSMDPGSVGIFEILKEGAVVCPNQGDEFEAVPNIWIPVGRAGVVVNASMVGQYRRPMRADPSYAYPEPGTMVLAGDEVFQRGEWVTVDLPSVTPITPHQAGFVRRSTK